MQTTHNKLAECIGKITIPAKKSSKVLEAIMQNMLKSSNPHTILTY